MPENKPRANYTEYTTEFRHQRHEGICANPIAGPAPQNASLVRLHAPIEFLQVFWTATREGASPVLPSVKSYLANGNRLFLGGSRIGAITPTFGGHVYSVSGVYVFLVVAPEGLTSNFFLSKCPWEGYPTDNAMDFYIPKENFVSGILNPNWMQPVGILPDPDVSALDLQMAIEG